MVFRKATNSDLTNIIQVYKAAIKHMDDTGIHQWDETYPSKNIIEGDIVNKEMYIGFIDNVIASILRLVQSTKKNI